jgi:hypothetical protein
MTHDQTASLIKKIFLVILFAAIITAAGYGSGSGGGGSDDNKLVSALNLIFEKVRKKPAASPPSQLPIIHHQISDDPDGKRLDALLQSIVSPENGVAIAHLHCPGDPDSEQLVGIYDSVRKKYGRLVLVVRISYAGYTMGLRAQGVTKLPHTVMISGNQKVFEFQGLWSQIKIEQLVDNILHGLLKRVNKDWRPAVPGMQPVGP